MRCVFHAVAPTSSFRRVTRAERQKFIAVIFVLFLARRDLGGETDGEVAAERVELVEDRDDAILDVEGWERNLQIFDNLGVDIGLTSLSKRFNVVVLIGKRIKNVFV